MKDQERRRLCCKIARDERSAMKGSTPYEYGWRAACDSIHWLQQWECSGEAGDNEFSKLEAKIERMRAALVEIKQLADEALTE